MEGAMSSLSLNSAESNWSMGFPFDVVSQEDVTWADSCLINDLHISSDGRNSWSYLKDALNEVPSSKRDPPPARLDDLSFSSGDIGTSQILNARVDDLFTLDEGADEDGEVDQLIDEDTNRSRATFNSTNVFRPGYCENLTGSGINVSEDPEVLSIGSEQSTGEIFKVWNLDIPDEEDEFIIQLNKAFTESSLELIPPVSDGSKLSKGLKIESIDDVISGMAGLSLNRTAL